MVTTATRFDNNNVTNSQFQHVQGAPLFVKSGCQYPMAAEPTLCPCICLYLLCFNSVEFEKNIKLTMILSDKEDTLFDKNIGLRDNLAELLLIL